MPGLSDMIGEIAEQKKPDAAQIAAHARSILANELIDPKIALDAITAILAELRSKFCCDEQELVPITQLITYLTELSTSTTRKTVGPEKLTVV